MKKIVLPFLIAMLSVGPALADKQVIKSLGKCGSEAGNSFGKHTEKPAIDEGNGYVGIETEDIDATGTKEKYTLVNCSTRKVVQLKAEYLLTDSSEGLVGNKDLFAYVDGLRKQKKLANEDLFAKKGKAQGYETIVGKLAAKGTEKAERGDCACMLYYPETMY
jgi:hypothetical protein